MFPIFDSIENSISGYMQLIIIYKHIICVFIYKWKHFTHVQVLLEKQYQTQTTAHSDL